ncbi:MAG: ComEC family competence protein [Holosporaceae bacterium]|jgi:competence protein ComEC|nr:ComEC family competence protein [Holosporaceae bacterium]
MNVVSRKIIEFASNFYESERRRLPDFIPVGIGGGICWYFLLEEEPNFRLTLGAFLLCLALFALADRCRGIAAMVLAVSFGFLVSQLRTNSVNTFMLSESPDRPISFVATIEFCEKTENGLKFIVRNATRKYNDSSSKLCRKFSKLHLIWKGKKALEEQTDFTPGTRVLFRAVLSPIYPAAFPGAYDFRKQHYFKSISARGFLIKPPKIIKKASVSSMQIFIEKIRHRINKKMEKYLSRDTAAIGEALITGNTAGISKEVRTTFANTGIAHILAISGLHMGIIGFFIFWLSRIILCCFPAISMFFDIKKIAAVASWLVTLIYLGISGCSVPSLRAFIMHTLIITAILCNRTALTMRSVAIAATLVMTFTPEVILFPSFQMSFGAVMAIVAFYEVCQWRQNAFVSVLMTTVIASIPTSIISVSTFNQLTLNSIPANMISIPLMSFYIMPMAVAVLFFMMFGLSKQAIILMGYGIDLLKRIAEEISKLPGSFFVMPTPSTEVTAIFIVSGLFLMMIHHRIRVLGIFGLLLGVIVYFLQPKADVFIAPHGKALGLRTGDAVCFNNLAYFRSAGNSWAKSVGFEKRERYDSKKCRRCISPLNEDTWVATLNGQRIVLTKDDDYQKHHGDFAVFHLGSENNEATEIMYLLSGERKSTASIKRPWTR